RSVRVGPTTPSHPVGVSFKEAADHCYEVAEHTIEDYTHWHRPTWERNRRHLRPECECDTCQLLDQPAPPVERPRPSVPPLVPPVPVPNPPASPAHQSEPDQPGPDLPEPAQFIAGDWPPIVGPSLVVLCALTAWVIVALSQAHYRALRG